MPETLHLIAISNSVKAIITLDIINTAQDRIRALEFNENPFSRFTRCDGSRGFKLVSDPSRWEAAISSSEN